MTTSYDRIVTAPHRGKALPQLLAAPVDALKGVSASDAAHLKAAFNIDTIEEMGQNELLQRAAGLVNAQLLTYDSGPPLSWTPFFASAPIDYYRNHPAGRFRLDFGPVYYRGRLDGSARVLVVGQDPSTNELLAHRIFAGRSGQRVQRLLQKLGITRSYIMLNTFLFSVFGQFDTELRNISNEPTIEDYRNAFLDRIVDENPIEAVISFGKGAQHACNRWANNSQPPIFNATHPAANETFVISNWNELLSAMQAIVTSDDDGVVETTPFGPAFTVTDLAPIPSFDLPFGVPDWHGRSGGHSTRDGNKKIIWSAP
jgi:hypothetical protein